MTIRQRLALGYAVITIPLTAFAAISFYMMESKVKSIGEFHAPALSSYQKLMSDAMEAVQESFAYVASGEEIERHDFLVWANGFSAEAAGFRSFTGMHNPGEETERALFDAIEVIQADLVKKAHLMFREYDTAGSISLSTFSDYEQTVDELSMLFKAFLEIERQEMSGAHRRATTTISHSQEIIIALGALSVILAFASGLFVVRSISESAGKMKDAMSKVAAGNLDVSLSVDSNDEFGKLADSFHRMTADLRDARSELRATLDYIDNILGSMNDSLVVVTPELRIQTVNQATCDLLGYSKDEIIGLPFTSIVSNGESRKLGLGNLYRLEEANLPEISYRSRDGRLIPVSFSGSLLRGKNGSLLGVVCVAQDLTERKQAEMREREMHAAMERAERMESIGSLAGGVAHDLNNMLGPLVAYPDMIIKHLPEDNPARRLVQRIGKTANEAADVIQDLLTLAGRGKYELRPTNLNDAISGYLISPSFIGLSEGHESVRVTTQLDESISKISGSPTHLMKIVMNLAVNAFQAMPNGGELSIGTSQKRLDRLNGGYEGIIPGKYVLLRIRDTGKGIRSDQLSRIFEPYYTTKEMGVGGSGLGLSVVYGIVKDHHGYYDVFSTAGDGTEFVLYFPVTELTERVPYVREGKLDGTETILVVDDNEEQRELATICLASLGYSVESVCGGREAIEFLSKKEVDLVVLDMIMEEGFDGLDTFLELRKMRPEQKFVIASGYSETERVQRMQELGAGAYIRKPYALETLGEAIREELDKKPNRLAGSTGQIHT